MEPRELTQERPDSAQASLKRLFERANAEQAEGRLADAEATCREILARDERHAGAWHLLGILAFRAGHAQQAAEHVERAVALAPSRADSRCTLGFVLRALNRPAEAEAAFLQATARDPDFVEAHYQLGNLLRETQRPAEAEPSYRRVLELRPTHHQAHNNLGATVGELNRFEEAAGHFRRAIEIKPDYAEACSNLGHALRAVGQAHGAEVACRRALAIAPRFATAHLNLGLALQDMGRLDAALDAFRQSVACDPGYAKAIASEGMLHLLRGELAAGWEKYEARWRIGDLPPRNFAQPQWRGEAIEGKTILLHAEQGFGDAIQFLRYVPRVLARGARVVLEVARPLLPLASRISGIAVVARGDPLPAFDTHCPLLSLPLAFATTLESIPTATPYLTVAPERAAHWRTRVGGPGLKVGLAWAGSAVHRNDQNRSIALDRLAPLLEVEGVRWFSLQVGPHAADLAARQRPTIVDLAAELTDFGETAAAIAALDLVICADTAVAHLAGALGKPVWVMLPFAPDWRWLIGRDDSPWYPSMRLFRQQRAGDWHGVAARVRAALATRVAAPSAPRTDRATRAELAELVRAANEHHQAKRHAECEAALRRVLEIDPNNATALHVLALTRHALDDYPAALSAMHRAIELDPQAGFYCALAIMLHGAGQYEEAVEAGQRALALNPDDPITHNSIGASLSSRGRPTEAIDAYQRALAINPNYFECWANLAHSQQLLLHLDEAADSYRRALGIQYDYPQAQVAAGMLALLRGDFANGFTQFEWRWRLKTMTPRDFKEPRWQGEPLAGKTILLHAEQGAGDTLQCLRFVPQVAARGGRLLLELPQTLMRLATSLEGGGEIFAQGQKLPAFDVHCAFMSLPRVLGTTLDTLPTQIPYLHPDPAAVERWSRRLAGTGSGLRVGIAWAGNPKHAGDRRRSIALERLAPILDVPGVRFYSLQVGERAGDLGRVAGAQVPDKVVDLAPELKTYTDTAAVLAHLDLLISVDTSVVHLAGALGRPCWVMLPFSPDWRWLIEREDSPWYRTLRLFRQPAPDDWDSVIGRVAATLAARVVQPVRGPQLDAGALYSEAEGLRTAGRPADAEAAARRILASEPGHIPSLRLLGVIRDEAGDHAAAADLFARVTELAPDDADAHYNLGTSLLALSRAEEAAARLRRAVALAPQHAKALNNLGSALRALRRLGEAEETCRRAIEVAPELPTAWNNLGIVHADQGRAADAADCFRRAVTIKADFADGWFNLGKALQSDGRREEALAQFRRAIELRADYPNAQMGEAFLLLVMGDFVQGLPRLEWRWRLPEKSPRPFTQPLWRGENLGGKTILLHAEQGFGDSLMLLRYAPLVAARGGRVVIEVPRALERLATRLAGGPYTLVVGGQPLPAFDLHCPLMSLPLAFGTTPETIPAAVPYFTAAPDAVARWRARLATVAGMKIGIVWAGNPVHLNDASRSIALDRLGPLFELPGTQWFSLQVGERARDLAKLPAGRVTDLAPDPTDFAETAAAISALDLVICVDTAVAHLAGALGHAVWLLLPFDPDWRWLLERGDSPWYPAARLVRQQAPGDWDGVIARVRAALLDCVERARRSGVPEHAPSMLDRRYFEAVELIETHRDAEADAALRAILAEDAGHPAALRRLAWMCHRRGDNAEAARLLTRTIEREPDNPETHYNLGVVLAALGRHAEAEASYRRGLALRPGSVDGHNNLGVLLEQVGRYDEAEACYRQAMALSPEHAHPLNNLGVLLKEEGRLAEAIETHRRAILLDPALPAAHSNLLYTLNYDEATSPQALFAEHEAWGRRHGAPFATDGTRFANPAEPGRRLRVGYVSGDFRHHSVAFFVEALVGAHDKREVEVFLFANDARSDAATERLKRHADHFVPIYNLPDDLAAAQIRDRGIDVLVDLSGHTSGNRMMLFARKPAPVGLTWLGYPATTGLATIDGRITDAVADPPGDADRLHTERLIRLDGGFLCYRPLDQAGAVAPLPARGAGHITFGSFNNRAKLSPRTIATWAEIMRRTPNARLLLKATQFKDAGTRERCRDAFVAAGVAGERIEILPPLRDAADHLALYGRVDIALDPLVYNGTTTTCEALWMGVPVVTLRGDRHAARVGASILTTTGLTALIAETTDDYVDIATQLASEPDALAEVRAGLRERMRGSPLCDTARFARAMERAYRDAWRGWCMAQAAARKTGAGPAAAGGAQAPEAIETKARQLLDAKKLDEAEELLRALTGRAPQRAMAWFLLGRVRHAQGDLDAAIDFLRKAIALDPRLVPAHNDLGIFLQGRGQLAEAETCYRRAVEVAPRFAEAMSNLGAVLAERGRLDEASGWYSRAITERRDFADAHNNLGATLVKLDRAAEAEALHRRAISLKPDFADAHYNLGVALHDQGRFDEALESYDEAARLNPDFVDARWNRAFMLLTMGRYAEGWREHEWRWRRKQQPPRSFPQPLWKGEPASGRTILLHFEQGTGDTLQFRRYAPIVAAGGARVLLQVQRPLQRLVRGSVGSGIEVLADGDVLPPFDLHSPLLSLPLACATSLDTIPAPVPYVAVDPAIAARWRERIGQDGGRKIGLVWAGNPQHKNDRNRSIALERLLPLLGAAETRWFSLQVGERAGDLARLAPDPMVNLADHLTDFAETAGAIDQLDLVITVDTAVAHLAGALGKAVWILLPAVPDWRWLLGRSDCPWYPTARLFRQPARGDWDCVVQALHGALEELASKKTR